MVFVLVSLRFRAFVAVFRRFGEVRSIRIVVYSFVTIYILSFSEIFFAILFDLCFLSGFLFVIRIVSFSRRLLRVNKSQISFLCFFLCFSLVIVLEMFCVFVFLACFAGRITFPFLLIYFGLLLCVWDWCCIWLDFCIFREVLQGEGLVLD